MIPAICTKTNPKVCADCHLTTGQIRDIIYTERKKERKTKMTKYEEMINNIKEMAKELAKEGKSLHGYARDLLIDYELREMEKNGEPLSK